MAEVGNQTVALREKNEMLKVKSCSKANPESASQSYCQDPTSGGKTEK